MAGHGRMIAGLITSTALAAGLLMGGAVPSSAQQVVGAATVDRPNPKERTRPGDDWPDPRCDRAQQGLDAAKANVAQARQRLKAAPKKKKAARKKQLKAAKQTRTQWKARVSAFC